MRPAIITQTGTGTTNWVPVDYIQSPFNLGLQCAVNGTVTYTIQYTADDPLTGTPSTTLPVTGLSASTVTAGTNLQIPCRAVRASVSSGAGSVTLTLLQGTSA